MERTATIIWGGFQLVAAATWILFDQLASTFASVCAGLASIVLICYTIAKWRRLNKKE